MLSLGWKVERPYSPVYPVKRWVTSSDGEYCWQEHVASPQPKAQWAKRGEK